LAARWQTKVIFLVGACVFVKPCSYTLREEAFACVSLK
ncbi:unnamed protein product, partial [marine sediment metagenome]